MTRSNYILHLSSRSYNKVLISLDSPLMSRSTLLILYNNNKIKIKKKLSHSIYINYLMNLNNFAIIFVY